MTMQISPEKGELPYPVIKDALLDMFTALSNLLERSWPRRYEPVNSSGIMFCQSYRKAVNTFQTIFYLCADSPPDPLRHRMFVLSLPALTRTLYEQLIMFIFLLEDIPNFVPFIMKTGYVEKLRELDHCVTYHGTKTHWAPYIADLELRIKRLETSLNLTPREVAKPYSTIGGGPTPGQLRDILKNNRPGSTRLAFLEYIKTWLYRELSGQTHLNIVELVETSIFYFNDEARERLGVENWEEERNRRLDEYRQTQISLTITLMLAISTELDLYFNYGQRERLLYLWTILIEYSDATRDLWETEYQARLSPP